MIKNKYLRFMCAIIAPILLCCAIVAVDRAINFLLRRFEELFSLGYREGPLVLIPLFIAIAAVYAAYHLLSPLDPIAKNNQKER